MIVFEHSLLDKTDRLDESICAFRFTVSANLLLDCYTLYECVFVGQRVDELEGQLKEKECELLKRDRVITDLRVRLPASSDRDAVFDKVVSQSARSPRDEDYEASQAVRVATSTVSSLQVGCSQCYRYFYRHRRHFIYCYVSGS